MTDQTLYYTLSTIALCTAICFSLLGIMLLYRLQIADRVLKELAHHLVAITTRARINTEIPSLITARKYERAYEELSTPGNPSETLQTNHTALLAELHETIQLRLQFRRLTLSSLGLIATSVSALALVNHYAANPLFPIMVTVLFLGWFVRILVMMEKLIRGCFSH